MTVTTTTTPRTTTSKRPERGIWQSNRLSAKKSERPAQLEPPQSPTEKLHDRLGRTDQPSRSSSESPVRQEPSREEGQQTDTLSKPGPYKISFWWAPPSNPTPTPRSSAETNTSTKVASNHESSLKPETPSSPTPTTKPDYVASRTSERNQGNSSKPEPINVMKSDPSPTPKSNSPVDPFASEQNWGDSSPVYDIVCEFSSVPPSPESNRPSASPQPHHPRKQSPSPESKSPISSTQPHHPVIRPSSPESPTISIGEISHSSSSSSEHRSAAANRTLISPLSLNFVHPLPPKPTPPKPLPPSNPLLDSLQASNPYSNLFSSSTSSSPKPSQDSPDSRKDMPSITSQPPKPVLDSALQALKPSSTMLSSSTPPKSPIAEYKFSGRLRPPPATSNPGDAYSLISRSGADEKNGSSLLSIGAQMGLFAWIRQELTAVRKLSDSRDENDEETEIDRIKRLHHLVDTIRKLREGVRAANKLDAFAVEVYELSVSTCLMKPLHREELHRSLRVLSDVLYPSVPSCKNKLRYLSVDLLWRLQGEEDDIASAHCRLSEAIKTDGEGAEGQRAVAEAVVDIRVALALGDYVGFRVGCKALQGLELGVLVKNLLPRFRHQTLDALKKAYIFIPMQKLAGYMLLDPEQHVPFYMSAEDCPRWQRLVDYLIEHGIKEEQIRGDVVHMKENSLSRT